MNGITRRPAFWIAFALISLIAGIYGMNFEHMPELNWTFGYPLALGAMLLVVIVLYIVFKKKRWL